MGSDAKSFETDKDASIFKRKFSLRDLSANGCA
jgi:hypothetical protein